MPARLGETSKTSRWAFLMDERNYPLVLDALRKNNIPAAVSPLHDLDVWDRPAILNYCESWTYQRVGLVFFYDERFAMKDAFTFKEVMQRTDTPLYAVWFGDNLRPTDKDRYGYSEEYQACYVELPIVGEVKKPHYHVQVHLDQAITRRAFLAKIGLDDSNVYYWQPVGNPAGLLRYFAHMDNSEKAQYRKSDILSLYGFDLSALYRKTEAGKVAEFEYLYAVVDSCPAEYCNLATVCDTLIEAGHPEIAYALRSGSGFWKEIIFQKSKKSHKYDPTPDFRKTDFQRDGGPEKVPRDVRAEDRKHFDEWRASLAAVTNVLL